MTVISIHHHGAHHVLLRHRPHLFHIRFKTALRADSRRRRCVVTIITMTDGDAEDAS